MWRAFGVEKKDGGLLLFMIKGVVFGIQRSNRETQLSIAVE